jgi:hypothetical protein
LSLLLAVLLLPSLFWNKGPDTAKTLAQAGIHSISVPPSLADSWKPVGNFTIQVVDPDHLTKLPVPGISFHEDEASATRAPWVNSNGWRFIRKPEGSFYYDAPGAAASLAAAEAFMYGAHALIHTDEAGLPLLGRMLQFLTKVGSADMQPLVNIGFIDDGSAASGEFMNLLVRRNVLFKVVQPGDSQVDVKVALGSAQYPRSEAGNPVLLAEKVRANLTDEKRLVRLYGSDVVIGRLVGNGKRARLYLLNYGASKRAVDGIRVRILGDYSHPQLSANGDPQAKLMDVSAKKTALEFTVPELKEFAVVDLTR